MPPETTLWPLAPHTGAKHQLLRAYLMAWFPILGSAYGRVVFIDGFAGPGEYSGGEIGSPLVALEAAAEHPRLARRDLMFLFIEADTERYKHLASLIEARRSSGLITENVKCSVVHGTFEQAMNSVRSSLGDDRLAPAFVMIDPFGPSGVPYDVIQWLASYRHTELLISFMYESMSRFLGAPEFAPHLDSLFGCPDWRNALAIADADRKRTYLRGLFQTQLERTGMEHVRSFQMLDSGGRTEYFLFFATHHEKGMEVMKDVMWSVDPSGAYRFSDVTDPDQFHLFELGPDYGILRASVVERFADRRAGIAEIERFVTLETPFRKAHLRDGVLKPLEEEEIIEVDGRQRRRTYPRGSHITFR